MYTYEWRLVPTFYGWVWQLAPVFVPVYAPIHFYPGQVQSVQVISHRR